MRHHAIVVAGPMKSYAPEFQALQEVWGEVLRLAERHTLTTLVSPIVKCSMNGYGSFFIAPDGSKEGWAESDSGDAFRDVVVAYLEKLKYEDGSTSFDYVEVQFGDDEHETRVVRDSDVAIRAVGEGT